MNEELMAIEKNNIMTQIGKVVPNRIKGGYWLLIQILLLLILILLPLNYFILHMVSLEAY